jgi:hypothetical protein
MKQKTTTVNYAAVKVKPSSRRSVILFAVIPFLLLLIGSGLAPFLTHRAQASALPLVLDAPDAQGPGVITSRERLKQIRRMAALDTMDRLEKETRRSGGKGQITTSDLNRLRNALNNE